MALREEHAGSGCARRAAIFRCNDVVLITGLLGTNRGRGAKKCKAFQPLFSSRECSRFFRILDFLREVFPRQPVLPVVVRVEVVENLPGLRFGEDGFLFVGSPVDVFAGPEQRDFVRPELFQ